MSIFVLFPSLDFSISIALYFLVFIHGLVVVLTASLIVVGEVLFLSSYLSSLILPVFDGGNDVIFVIG